MNPITTLHMASGRNIVIELLPESAPSTVNSLIYTASGEYLDHHIIERIVSGNRVNISCTTFRKKECRYLIPNELEPNPDVAPLDSRPGAVCMGGYGEAGLAGCELFFPLGDCPDHKGIYSVFGRVLEGTDELYRLEKVETVLVTGSPIEGVEANRPVEPEIIERVELGLHSEIYPESVRVREPKLLECWR